MENIRDLLFNQDTLDLLLEKWGIAGQSFLIPWSNGFALTDQVGNITNYLNIDANGQLLFQNQDFSTIGSVSSVSDFQYQLYNGHQLTGNLFTNDVASFLDLTHDGTSELLSDVLDLDVDSVDTLLNINDLIDFF